MTSELKESEISQLRRACECLYLEVPAPIADDVKAKAEAVIAIIQRHMAEGDEEKVIKAAALGYVEGHDTERARIRKAVEGLVETVQVLPELPGLWQLRSAAEFKADVLAIIDAAPEQQATCTWTHDDIEDKENTQCGEAFLLDSGTPIENKMKFCCYCGKVLVEKENEDEIGPVIRRGRRTLHFHSRDS